MLGEWGGGGEGWGGRLGVRLCWVRGGRETFCLAEIIWIQGTKVDLLPCRIFTSVGLLLPEGWLMEQSRRGA